MIRKPLSKLLAKNRPDLFKVSTWVAGIDNYVDSCFKVLGITSAHPAWISTNNASIIRKALGGLPMLFKHTIYCEGWA